MMVQLQEVFTVICKGELFTNNDSLAPVKIEAEIFGAQT